MTPYKEALIVKSDAVLSETRIASLALLPPLKVTCPTCLRGVGYTYKNGLLQSHFSDKSRILLCDCHSLNDSHYRIIRAFFINFFLFCQNEPVTFRPERPKSVWINAQSELLQFYLVEYKDYEINLSGSLLNLAAPLLLNMWDDLTVVLNKFDLKGELRGRKNQDLR